MLEKRQRIKASFRVLRGLELVFANGLFCFIEQRLLESRAKLNFELEAQVRAIHSRNLNLKAM